MEEQTVEERQSLSGGLMLPTPVSAGLGLLFILITPRLFG